MRSQNIIATAIPLKRRMVEKGYYGISVLVLAASFRSVVGFAILNFHTELSFPTGLSRRTRESTRKPSHLRRLLSLKYADIDDDDTTSSSTTRAPFVVNPVDKIEYENIQKEKEDNNLVKKDSMTVSQPTDISDAIKEVLTAPVISSTGKEDGRKTIQRLILPINTAEVNKFVDSKGTKAIDSDPRSSKKETRPRGKIELGRRWHRLRPGQKFRFRLGIISIAFVSFWNTVFARNYSGFITSILTGAAATTTATGFGSILRRWFSNRGFQGIAALGRSFAYGWAIFVAYPRMLDRRAKERRLKRDEEVLNQWRRYLEGTANEVVRLRKELSLLEGEIRTFRREILAIRAARVDSDAAISKKNGNDGSENTNSTRQNNKNDSSNKSERILREAIMNEMTHLTRLRDDTRLALTAARNRWSEVRAKRPTRHSQSAVTSAFDALEFGLDTAAFEYDTDRDNSNNDPLLKDF